MKSDLKKESAIKRELLSEGNFLETLLNEALSYNIIKENELEKIQRQMAELLTCELERYTVGESSSVRTETAQGIFASLCYTVGVSLKTSPDGDSAAKRIRKESISELLAIGKHAVNRKIKVAKLLYLRSLRNRISTKNFAYNETINSGVIDFFKSYDNLFAANETPASIDYPLCADFTELSGIEYIIKYLDCLYLENSFCKKFHSSSTEAILRGYHSNFEDLLINIFERVLINAFGCIILGRNLFELSLTSSDTEALSKLFSEMTKDDIVKTLKKYTPILLSRLNIKNPSLEKYILLCNKKIAAVIKLSAENKALSKIFITGVDAKEKAIIEFNNGAEMDGEAFRDFLEELKNCRYASDKIKMIVSLKSFNDILDVLRGECLFDDEFKKLFLAFGETELSLLYKEIPPDIAENKDHLTEGEKAWINEYIKFFHSLPSSKKEKIIDLADKLVQE